MGNAERKAGWEAQITRHYKLVRSKIPEIITANGEQADWHPLSLEDTLYHLTRSDGKLQEEVTELLQAKTPEKVADEAADVIQVALDIAYHWGVSEEEVERLRKNKQEERGDFKTGAYLVSSGPPEAYKERERHIKRIVKEMAELTRQKDS